MRNVLAERDAGIIAILNEDIRPLVQFHIATQHFIYEMITDALVRSKQFYQRHQLFQYHAVADSKPLAGLLLSLESAYPASYQLALDMLKRILTANEEIVEILLSKSKILTALRFARRFIILFVVISDAVATLVALHTSKSVFYCCLKAMNELANSLSFMVGR